MCFRTIESRRNVITKYIDEHYHVAGSPRAMSSRSSLLHDFVFTFACVRLMVEYTLDNAFPRADKPYVTSSNEIIIERDRSIARRINSMLALFVATRRRINGSINYVDDVIASGTEDGNARTVPCTEESAA